MEGKGKGVEVKWIVGCKGREEKKKGERDHFEVKRENGERRKRRENSRQKKERDMYMRR